MTSGYNDRTCTNGKGGIKSVLFFPLENKSGVTKTSNEITAITVSGETFHYKLRSNLSNYTAPIRRSDENGTLWYEQNTDDEYFKKAVMVGETLDPETKSGNVKDVCADNIPQYSHRRLYNRDGTYSRSKVISTINSGLHILNHAGHCNTEIMMDLNRGDVDTLITNTEYFLGYSTGCYAAAFDADCVVEHYIYNPNGAFAFISNSRYGWYYQGMMNGAGDVFDYEFFKVLNDTANNLAKTLQISKENLAGQSQTAHHQWLARDQSSDVVAIGNPGRTLYYLRCFCLPRAAKPFYRPQY